MNSSRFAETEARFQALGVLQNQLNASAPVTHPELFELFQIGCELPQHLGCDVVAVGELQQALDRGQIFYALPKGVHLARESRRPTPLKMAGCNAAFGPVALRTPRHKRHDLARDAWQCEPNARRRAASAADIARKPLWPFRID